jgi:hypothetical protein
MLRFVAVFTFWLSFSYVLVANVIADANAQQTGSQYKGVHRNSGHATSTRHRARPRDTDQAAYRSELSRAKSEWRHAQRGGAN